MRSSMFSTSASGRTNISLSFAILILSSLLSAWSADGAPARPRLFARHTKPLPPDLNAQAQTQAAVAPRAGGLTIIPAFDSSITNNGRAADIMATINSAISVYQAAYTANVTAN